MLIEPVGVPPLQVTLTLHGRQVTIQSTVPHGTEGWTTIRQICLEGMLAAHAQVVLAEQGRAGSAPLVIVPTLDAARVGG